MLGISLTQPSLSLTLPEIYLTSGVLQHCNPASLLIYQLLRLYCLRPFAQGNFNILHKPETYPLLPLVTPICRNELERDLGLSTRGVFRHLNQLADVNWIQKLQQGQHVVYQLGYLDLETRAALFFADGWVSYCWEAVDLGYFEENLLNLSPLQLIYDCICFKFRARYAPKTFLDKDPDKTLVIADVLVQTARALNLFPNFIQIQQINTNSVERNAP